MRRGSPTRLTPPPRSRAGCARAPPRSASIACSSPPISAAGGVGALGMVALHEAVGRSGCVLGHLALGGDGGLLRFSSGAQRERFLGPVLRGEATAALTFTDARDGPRTTARGRGETFLVSGVKAFVTGGARADLLLTVAKVTEHPRGGTGTARVVIPRGTPGVTLRRRARHR